MQNLVDVLSHFNKFNNIETSLEFQLSLWIDGVVLIKTLRSDSDEVIPTVETVSISGTPLIITKNGAYIYNSVADHIEKTITKMHKKLEGNE